MTISQTDLAQLVNKHDQWVEEQRPQWKKHRAAYETKFWRESNDFTELLVERGGTDTQADLPVRVDANRVLPWVQSYISNLFYKGARTTVRADVVMQKGQVPAKKEEKASVAELNDRFLNSTGLQEQAELGFQLGLMYGAFAWKLGVDDSTTAKGAVDAVWAEVVPTWECFWDRNETSKARARYIGRISWWAEEDLQDGWTLPDGTEAAPRPDIVVDGAKTVSELDENAPAAYYRILELYDRTGVYEAASAEKALGTRSFWLVGTSSQEGSGAHLTQLGKTEPVGHVWANGQPLIPIIPVVLENVPEHPLEAVPPIAAVYEMASEMTFSMTVSANQFRREAARVGFYDKARVDEKALAGVVNGKDCTLVGIEGSLKTIPVAWLEPPRDSGKQNQYDRHLNRAMQEVQGTSQQSRGQQGSYLTATESQIINDYDQNTFGLYRKRMDKSLTECCRVHLRMLMAAMKDRQTKAIEVRVGRDIIKLTVKALDRRWNVTLIDTQNSPVAAQQRKTELMAIQKTYTDLLGLVAGDRPEVLTAGATAMLSEIVRLWDLPDAMDPLQLLADTPEAPVEPPEEAPPTPEELAAAEQAMQDPAVQEAVGGALP